MRKRDRKEDEEGDVEREKDGKDEDERRNRVELNRLEVRKKIKLRGRKDF